MGDFKDPFEGLTPTEKIETAEMPLPKSAETETHDQPRAFKPVSAAVDNSEVAEVDDIFSFAEAQFKTLSSAKTHGEGSEKVITTNEEKKTVEASEIMTPEMIEISAVMYVQILEVVWSGVCSWFSGISTDYNFDKKLKDRYERISAMYFEAQNIRLTPTHFFVLMTCLVLFSPAFKAFGDRKRRLKAENFRKKVDDRNRKNVGSQAVLFESETVQKGRVYYAAEKDADGVSWYTKDAVSGTYAKKSERERVPPELETFIFDFKERNGAWPTKKQVETFLNS